MVVGVEGHAGIWRSVQFVLVPAVPPSLRCLGPDIPISPAGGSPGTLLQPGTALPVSKLLSSHVHIKKLFDWMLFYTDKNLTI